MSPSTVGVLWCLVFIVLEAVQSVYFGGVLQRMDSFLIGFLVFGITTTVALLLTGLRAPVEILRALRRPWALLGVNLTAAGAWILYLLAVQTIEPAVVYTIFSGTIPLTTIVAARLGVPEANDIRSGLEGLGNVVLLVGLAVLAVATLTGWSGFVRGGLAEALLGLGLTVGSGVIVTWMLFFCRRLDRVGVGPLAQFGLRFVLYVALAGFGALLGLDHKEAVPTVDTLYVVAVGLAIMALPLYAVQKAIALVSPLTIGAVGALGPLVIFLLQLVEGRVDYAPVTLCGLLIYFTGALIAAYGGALGAARPAPDARGA